jgi:hypothetical protein
MAKAFISSLTPDAVEHLNDRENIVVRAGSSWTALALLLGGIAIVVFVGLLTYDYRWSPVKFALLGLVLFAAACLLTFGFRKWFLSRGRSVAPGLIVTRENGVFVDDESLVWFPLVDLVNADYRHQFNGRNYEFSTLTVTYPAEGRKYRVNGIDLAESTVDEIEDRKRQCLVRSNRSDGDVSVSILDTIPMTRSTSNWKSVTPMILLALAFGAAGTFGAQILNEYFHDHLSWRKAAETNSAASYREYIRMNSNGRHRDDATSRLKAFYDNAEARYRASLKPGFDQAAVDSILALLRYARETHQYQIKVSFERSADIPPDLIERLKADFEVKTVLPLGDTFTQERMIERETQLFAILQSSFKQIFPDDVLELVLECASECAGVNILYKTSFQNSIYYDLKEKEIPEEDRNWSPGILIEWTTSIAVPGEAQLYSFDLESAPADRINYDTVEVAGRDPQETDQNSFYDAMVTSSFDDFRAHFLFNLGLGREPHLDSEVPKTEGISAIDKRRFRDVA